MADIAPIIAPAQPAQTAAPSSSPAPTGGSDSSSFENVLAQTNAAQERRQQTTQNERQSQNDPVRDNNKRVASKTEQPASNTTKNTSEVPSQHIDADQKEAQPVQQTDTTQASSTAATAAFSSEVISGSQLSKEQRAFARMILDSMVQGVDLNNLDEKSLSRLKNEATRFLQSLEALPATNQLTGGNTKNGVQSIMSEQLEKLINANEAGVLTITRKTTPEQAMTSLQNLTQPVQVASGDLKSATQVTTTPLVNTNSANTPFVNTNSALTDAANIQQQGAQATNRQQLTVQDADSIATVEIAKTQSGLTKGIVVQEEVQTAAVPRSNDGQNSTLRQDINGNYLEARIESKTANNASNSNTNTGQQNNQQEIAANQAQALQSSQQNAGNDQSSSYSQVSQGVLDGQTAKTTQVSQPVSPFPGSTVSDDAIIQQVAHRFNVQLRNQETQINIRLQPAELGELKIDLTYREGAIRANVFAQSQHVQEILEKNMPRLRELLASQGINVEDIQVAAKSDLVGDFDLLQEQFAGNGKQGFEGSSNFDTDSFIETLEAADNAAMLEEQGVNVTV